MAIRAAAILAGHAVAVALAGGKNSDMHAYLAEEAWKHVRVVDGDEAVAHRLLSASGPGLAALERSGLALDQLFTVEEGSAEVARHVITPTLRRRLAATAHARTVDLGEVAIPASMKNATARERVRFLNVLNWIIFPENMVTGYPDKDPASMGYDKKEMIYAEGANDLTNLVTGSLATGVEREAKEIEILVAQRNAFLQRAGDNTSGSWADWFEPESHRKDGLATQVGVAAGVFTTLDGEKIVVFRGTYADAGYDNIQKGYRHWFLEKMEDQVKDGWTGARYNKSFATLTEEQLQRKSNTGLTENADLLDCAMRALTYKKVDDNNELVATATGIDTNLIEQYGFWPITQAIMSKVMPAASNGDMQAMAQDKLWLSGYSQGGMRASWVSMWLKKKLNMKYQTIVLSPVGVQCASRELFSTATDGMIPFVGEVAAHDQVTAYLHPWDLFANMDYQVGKVCLYGTKDMAARPKSQMAILCEKSVGYTGPQLVAGGGDAQDYAVMCRYWTHNLLWQHIEFQDIEVLKEDGTTDGGCFVQPIVDPAKSCPSGSLATGCSASVYLATGGGILLLVSFCVCLISGVAGCICKRRMTTKHLCGLIFLLSAVCAAFVLGGVLFYLQVGTSGGTPVIAVVGSLGVIAFLLLGIMLWRSKRKG